MAVRTAHPPQPTLDLTDEVDAEPIAERPPTAGSRAFARAATVALRFLVIVLALALLGRVLWQLRIVLLPVYVALLLCTALVPLVVRLEGRGWRPAAATAPVFVGFLLTLAAVFLLVIPPTAAELGDVGEAVKAGMADVEDWLVDGPLGLERSSVEEYTDDPVGKVSELFESSSFSVVSGAVMVGEAIAGIILALVLTFLFLKDGRRFQAWVLAHVPVRHRPFTRRAGGAAWAALGGYLRGAAILGLVEGTIVGVTLWAVGAPLAIPVAVLTFAAAFLPIIGAVVAGALATLVALSTVGITKALIVLAVVVVVQQLDGDLLAPVIYGRAVALHPALILVTLTTGGVLGGLIGAYLAVPLVAVAAAVAKVVWERNGERWLRGEPASSSA
jgi:putative heme transporter